MIRNIINSTGLIFWAVIVMACRGIVGGETAATTVVDEAQSKQSITATAPAAVASEAVAAEQSETVVVEPPSAGLALPKPHNDVADREFVWSQLLARDAILPIYEPEFVPAEAAPYSDDELVIGVEINGEAKAYAIGPLNSREMVNDDVGGVPILVTW